MIVGNWLIVARDHSIKKGFLLSKKDLGDEIKKEDEEEKN